jgi:hypothetical protein
MGTEIDLLLGVDPMTRIKLFQTLEKNAEFRAINDGRHDKIVPRQSRKETRRDETNHIREELSRGGDVLVIDVLGLGALDEQSRTVKGDLSRLCRAPQARRGGEQ